LKELPKKYSNTEREPVWQSYWDEQKVYAWDQSQPRENTFVIDTPPPTVSGVLHMGHIFSYTQADFVARYRRMRGQTVFYPMGFDDNGLPTERLVEKVKKISAHKYMQEHGREGFIKLCEEVVEGAEEDFRALFKSVALSVDWDQEYQTISEESRKISQMSFLDLFHKDRAYRKLQPMLWDPVDQTAIAQAEVEDKELKSHENYIYFGLADEDGTLLDEKLPIMTTRPELLPACVAVMVDPTDAEKFKGKQAVTPLFGMHVPIIADEGVDKAKGTGFVMCCTFGDETDIEWWKKHELNTRVVLNKYGKLDEHRMNAVFAECANVSEAMVYIERLKGKKPSNPDKNNPGAREIILELLQEAGKLYEQKEITHVVKCAERSGSPLEILPTDQWFVKILDQKEELKEKAAECNWNPDWMKLRIDQWIDGLSWDWCISRQRYFGVPFPVWYSKRAGEEGKIIVASPDQLPVNPLVDAPEGYSMDEVEPEADVMDTWATSSVSPQLSSKAINKEYAIDYARHEKLFPADLRPQAHEIIRTWAFYTIVKAHLHEDTIPWQNLMISGWCLASDKTKMSKSKGNVVTPVELIKEKGADAVRYWASTSKLGSDTAFSEDVLKIGNKLVNKLFNATKFAAIQLQKIAGTPTTVKEDAQAGKITEMLDIWVLSRLEKAIVKAAAKFEEFEYSDARGAVEDFFWNDFCDNYLEMVKVRAYGEAEGITAEQQQSAIYTMYHVIETVLRLFAPIVPHITEELYSHIFDDRHAVVGSIHARGMWPVVENYIGSEDAEAVGIASVEVLNAVRKAKADRNVSLKFPIELITLKGEKTLLEGAEEDLKNVANAARIEWVDAPKGDDILKTENEAFELGITFGEKDAA
jgi:valyl-tRNA synthetase